MDNALSTITQFNLTKSQITAFANKALNEIDCGIYNPLEIHICLKAMEEFIKKLKDSISEQVMTEAEKYGKQFEFMGSKVQLTERKTYDYSNDSIWCELDKAKKEREEMLKFLNKPVADTDTGEIVYPAQFKITPVLSITLPQ